jgi:predicted exporter
MSLARWREQINLPAISASLTQAAAELGYNPSVFADFNQWMAATVESDYTWPQDSRFIGDIKNILMPTSADGQSKLYMLFPDDEYAVRLADNNPFADVVVVSPVLFAEQLAKEIKWEFGWLGWTALAGIISCILLLYRNLSLTLAVTAPMLAGAAVVLLYIVFQPLPLNLFSVVALPLLLGLSIDYGIFMVHGCRTASYQQSRRAVLLSALTTLAGFGSLILASHPALHSLGITVSIGILGATLTAMFIPWLMSGKQYAR